MSEKKERSIWIVDDLEDDRPPTPEEEKAVRFWYETVLRWHLAAIRPGRRECAE